MITLNNISVIFNKGTPLESRLFKNLHLDIQPGDFVTVIGGNGAGKSTLMNILSGDIKVDAGTITLDTVDVTRWLPHERAGLISRVFQDPLLGSYADLSIEENLSLAFSRGKKRGFKKAIQPTVREYFQEKIQGIGLGLENRLGDKMGSLSGGQRQAVSLVMATLQPSKILLLDEHTAALDPKMEGLVLALTQRLICEKQLTTLMITHCMSQALEFGTRTLVLHQGKIVHDLKENQRNQLQASDLVRFF
jgi:putative tryptophan/tyrosine transport system ATP-binding protein